MDKIKILNPAHPGGAITSRKRAERYVARGVARWVGNALEFIEGDYRFVSARVNYTDGNTRGRRICAEDNKTTIRRGPLYSHHKGRSYAYAAAI